MADKQLFLNRFKPESDAWPNPFKYMRLGHPHSDVNMHAFHTTRGVLYIPQEVDLSIITRKLVQAVVSNVPVSPILYPW